MEQEKFEIWMMDYLSGDLDDIGNQDFEKYLKDNPKYVEEFENIRETWNEMNAFEVPEPSEKMDASFFGMLNAEVKKKENTKPDWVENIKSFFLPIQKPQLVFGMVLLAVGLGIGYFLKSNPSISLVDETVVSSNNETEEVREQLVLTLLEQPSANKRLQAVNEAAKLNKANERVIEALFTTLNNDPNINVRLVAVESLSRYVDTPEVRMRLVKSIVLQESPLVQITLAELMVKLQEKTSVKSMEILLEQPNINNTVKQKLEESINQII